jgi:hypothetical protein
MPLYCLNLNDFLSKLRKHSRFLNKHEITYKKRIIPFYIDWQTHFKTSCNLRFHLFQIIMCFNGLYPINPNHHQVCILCGGSQRNLVPRAGTRVLSSGVSNSSDKFRLTILRMSISHSRTRPPRQLTRN